MLRDGRVDVVNLLGIALAGSCLIACGALDAQLRPPPEYEVKAAFLYNFTKFIEWPPDTFKTPSDPLVIGILGEDPFDRNIERSLNGKIVHDRTLVVKHLDNLKEAAGCQVLFISTSKADDVETILNRIKGPPILTVSDMHAFIQHGGMLGLVLEKTKVRFDVNLRASEDAGLKISSQLLKLAQAVR